MNDHDSLDELVAMARGEVQPMTEERRERVLAAVLAAPTQPIAVPNELAGRRRRPVVVIAVVAAAALAAAVAAYWLPWPTTATPETAVTPPPPSEPAPPLTPPRNAPSDESRPGGTAPRPALVRGAPSPATPPQIVPPSVFAANQLSGDKNIFPDDETKVAIMRAGTAQLLIPVKVCVDRVGKVATTTVLKSSGFPAYDDKLVRGIRGWTYTPFTIDGAVVPVCSIVQFMYRQR